MKEKCKLHNHLGECNQCHPDWKTNYCLGKLQATLNFTHKDIQRNFQPCPDKKNTHSYPNTLVMYNMFSSRYILRKPKKKK